MIKRYRIADTVIQIASEYEDVHILCKDYATDEPPELSVTVRQPDIAYEREKSAAEDQKESRPVRQFSDGYLETLAVYRKIADLMTASDTLLFHGSAVAVDGVGYLFTAKSGTGKSTHTRLWREYFGERAIMVNDDKPLLKITDSGVLAYGTPWDGKHRLSSHISVPLKAICILTRADTNTIVPVTKAQAYPMLLQQSYRPRQPQALEQVLTLVDKLADRVSLYRLGCNMEREAAAVAYQGMKG